MHVDIEMAQSGERDPRWLADSGHRAPAKPAGKKPLRLAYIDVPADRFTGAIPRKCRGLCLRLHRIEGRQRGNIALDYCSCRQAEFFLKTSGDKLHTNWHAIG
jgi:hypothetical protein